MGFDKENKVRFKNLSPSLQDLIMSLRNHEHNSFDIPLWEHYHNFDDLSFYERYEVVQTGGNSNITDKNTYITWGDPDRYNVLGGAVEYPNHPLWVKHQESFTTPDGVRRLFLGCASPNGSTIYMSDENGLNPQLVAIYTAQIGVWDLAVFNGYLYALNFGDSYCISRTRDGVTWETVLTTTPGGHAKTLTVFNGAIHWVTLGYTWKSTDGTSWMREPNNLGGTGSQIYSRGVSANYMYIGTAGGGDGTTIYLMRSTNGINFTTCYGGSGHTYLRWVTPWKPKNSNVEYVVFGTGGSGNELGTACLMCYDPTTGNVVKLFDFRTGNGSLNDGHAPIEPRNSALQPIGFRERQIRYIQVLENDYTGENFLMIGCSDNHLYSELAGSNIYYKNGELWSAEDKQAWCADHVITQDGAATSYMGNIYAIGPKNNTDEFKLDNLIVSLIKHTQDTRVYSMSVYYDAKGKKWLYAGTGGGNYNGKGILYRLGYGEVLDIIQGTKLGAVMPPKWMGQGTLNKRITQTANSFYMKTIAGISAKDCYVEGRFSFIYNTILANNPPNMPFYGLIFNHEDMANHYILKYFPNTNSVTLTDVTNNIETILATYSVPAYTTYATTDDYEAINSPVMGPYYLMAAHVDGTKIKVYFKKSKTRAEIPNISDLLGTVSIPGDKIGRYGLSIFDIKGISLISMKQKSSQAFTQTEFPQGGIKFNG